MVARVDDVAHDEAALERLGVWVERYFGDTTPGVTTARFHAAVDHLMDEWERFAALHADDGEVDEFEDDEEDEAEAGARSRSRRGRSAGSPRSSRDRSNRPSRLGGRPSAASASVDVLALRRGRSSRAARRPPEAPARRDGGRRPRRRLGTSVSSVSPQDRVALSGSSRREHGEAVRRSEAGLPQHPAAEDVVAVPPMAAPMPNGIALPMMPAPPRTANCRTNTRRSRSTMVPHERLGHAVGDELAPVERCGRCRRPRPGRRTGARGRRPRGRA